jgi:glutamate decarboxylase
VHVYQVSPALTLIEKFTSRRLAQYFGLKGDFIGGITQAGGSASNITSLVIARNTLFPSTKTEGYGFLKLAIFTSADGHYSISKAAMTCGLGTSNVQMVPVNGKGQMDVAHLESAVQEAKRNGFIPFYVNATAGTTVLGAFDPFNEIADICKKHRMWMHIDGSWGGSVVFSPRYRHKLSGSGRADSIAMNPHKMLGVPITCSFLLGADMRKFHAANSLEAGYLFHEDSDRDADGSVWDLADLTLQCGRRGDSLKLALGWVYYGDEGYSTQIEHAFEIASYLASLVQRADDFALVSEDPPPCLQVCFYFAGAGGLSNEPSLNTKVTCAIVRHLVAKGYMIDHAPGKLGSLFRAVVNIQTQKETVKDLLEAIRESYSAQNCQVIAS